MSGGAAARASASRAANSAWIERLGRAGLATKGLLYIVVAVLALQVAFPGGERGETASQEGAIERIAHQPFGTVLLGLVAIGLAGYATWRLLRGAVGTPGGETWKRVADVVRGLLYASLAVFTVRVLTGSRSGGGSEQEITARLLELPFGVALVILLGLITIGVGAYSAYKGFTGRFRRELEFGRMGDTEQQAVMRLGRAGLVARGLVFLLIGVFFIQAALAYDPAQARGLDGALAQLSQTPAGPWLLGLVALGLMAYGLFCFAEARYGRINQLD
jgi:hypothetical protein